MDMRSKQVLQYVVVMMALLLLAGAQVGFAQSSGSTALQTVPSGSEIKVRTDSAIPAKPARGAAYSATVSEDVTGSGGSVVIPRGSRASLVAVPTDNGKDTVLDLRSVTVNGRRYSMETSATSQSTAPGGLGANTRTAKYVGG